MSKKLYSLALLVLFILSACAPNVRVIDIDPKNLLLAITGLPHEGKYYHLNGFLIRPNRNSEILSSWTVEEGKAYLAESGRIDGWSVVYQRGNSEAVMPVQVDDRVILYSSIEGAQIAITKYGDSNLADTGFKEIDAPLIGDATRGFMKSEATTSSLFLEEIYIMFSYRNVAHYIIISGWESDDVTIDFAVDVAEGLLAKLKKQPLSDAVTFAPKE